MTLLAYLALRGPSSWLEIANGLGWRWDRVNEELRVGIECGEVIQTWREAKENEPPILQPQFEIPIAAEAAPAPPPVVTPLVRPAAAPPLLPFEEVA